jgi:hypothetical protein
MTPPVGRSGGRQNSADPSVLAAAVASRPDHDHRQPAAQLIPAAVDHLVGPGEVTTTRLQLPDGLSFAEWEALGARLREVKSRWLWWLGDWCAYGERHYGDTYTAAVAASEYEPGTLRNAKYVAQRIDPSRRRDNLSWSHHYEVASLEPAAADRWLDRAIAEHWSQKALRAEIKAARSRLEGDVAVVAITEPTSIESEMESPELERSETEEPNGDQEARETAGVGDDGNAAHDQLRVRVQITIAGLKNTADELHDVNVALLARHPDAPLWLDLLENALNLLGRFYDALRQATEDEAADHDATDHPEKHQHGGHHDPSGRDPLGEEVK